MRVFPAYGQSVEEIAESLESVTSELQDELDNLEEYRYESDVEPNSAVFAIKNAKSTMRSVAISLLLESIDHSKKDDYHRVFSALKALAPEIFDQKSSKKQSTMSKTQAQTVYVTKTGGKYHRDSCRYVRKTKIAIDLSKAHKGYTACKVCKP